MRMIKENMMSIFSKENILNCMWSEIIVVLALFPYIFFKQGAAFVLSSVIVFLVFIVMEIKKVSIEQILIISVLVSMFLVFTYDILSIYCNLNIDFAAKHIIDIVMIYYLILWIRKKKRHIEIKIIIYLCACILFFTIGVLNPLNNLMAAIQTFIILTRFIPMFLLLREYEISYKKIYMMLYIFCIMIIILQAILGFHVDSRNGIFGIYGSSACALFLCIRMGFLIVELIENKAFKIKIVLEYITILGVFLIAENKSAMLICLFVSIVILIIYEGNIRRRLILLSTLLLIGLLGVIMISLIYPKFGSLFTINGIGSYIFGNSNSNTFLFGRFESGVRIFNAESSGVLTKIFGRGLGSAFPPENIMYVYNGSELVTKAYILNMVGIYHGYCLSGFSVFLIEAGIFGVLFIIYFLLIQYYIALKLLSNNDMMNRKYGSSMLLIAGVNTYGCLYGNSFNSINTMFITFLFMGVCHFKLRKKEKRESN